MNTRSLYACFSVALVALAACQASGLDDEHELLGDQQTALSSRGHTLTPDWFPEVITFRPPGCTATKIAQQKFLTAAHCMVDLAVGDTIRFTNEPLGFSAPAARIKSSQLRSIHVRNYVPPKRYEDEDDIAVFTIVDEDAPVYPAMRIRESFFGDGEDWFTQVGFGDDAIDPTESGTKQKADFFATYLSYWRDHSGGRSFDEETAVFNRYLLAFTDDNETRAPGDSGGPAVTWVSGRGWHVIGVHSGPSGAADIHCLARTSRAFNWIESVGNVPTMPCTFHSNALCSSHGATCERRSDIFAAEWDMCRWASKTTSAACAPTDGIWTTAESSFASNAPGSVPPGAAGACITQVTNLE